MTFVTKAESWYDALFMISLFLHVVLLFSITADMLCPQQIIYSFWSDLTFILPYDPAYEIINLIAVGLNNFNTFWTTDVTFSALC